MSAHGPVGAPIDLHLDSGTLHAESRGAASGALAVCVPGLSANLRGFDFIAERTAGRTRRVVALDLRGRGQSEVTAPGTYGWVSHARDVLGVADALGAASFDVVGQSMGAIVAMEIARLAPERVRSVVLIDACGVPDPATGPLIRAAVERLGTVYPSLAAYLEPGPPHRHDPSLERLLGALLRVRAGAGRGRRPRQERPGRRAGGHDVRGGA